MNLGEAQARAELSLAQGGRDTADLARAIVGESLVRLAPGERIQAGRRLRIQAQSVLDRIVILEALAGATWDEIADPFGLPASELERRYGAVVQMWRQGHPVNDFTTTMSGDLVTGSLQDPDPAGTAAMIDQWYARHAEPWEQIETPFGSRFS